MAKTENSPKSQVNSLNDMGRRNVHVTADRLKGCILTSFTPTAVIRLYVQDKTVGSFRDRYVSKLTEGITMIVHQNLDKHEINA